MERSTEPRFKFLSEGVLYADLCPESSQMMRIGDKIVSPESLMKSLAFGGTIPREIYGQLPEALRQRLHRLMQIDENAFLIPMQLSFRNLCDIILVNPLFPRREDNAALKTLLLNGSGYPVSQEWIKCSPLEELWKVKDMHILSGDWDKQGKTFTVYGSGLNTRSHLMLCFTISDDESDELSDLIDRLLLFSECSEKRDDQPGEIIFRMIVPLCAINEAGTVVLIDQDDQSSSWKDTVWKRAQLENFRLQLDYDYIDNGGQYQNAWVIDKSGNEIPAQMEVYKTDRGVPRYYLHWPEVRIGDFCVFFYEIETNKDDNIRSEWHVMRTGIGDAYLTIWQTRQWFAVYDKAAAKVNAADHGYQNLDLTNDDIFDSEVPLFWSEISSVDEQKSASKD